MCPFLAQVVQVCGLHPLLPLLPERGGLGGPRGGEAARIRNPESLRSVCMSAAHNLLLTPPRVRIQPSKAVGFFAVAVDVALFPVLLKK